MALIKCPECGREISDKAPACIHCGCPISAVSSVPAAPAAPAVQRRRMDRAAEQAPRSLSLRFHAVVSGADNEKTTQTVYVEELGREVEFDINNTTKAGEVIRITLREGSKYDCILFTAASVSQAAKSPEAQTPAPAAKTAQPASDAIAIIQKYNPNWIVGYVRSRRYYTIIFLCIGLVIKFAADGDTEYIPLAVAVTAPLWLPSILAHMFYPMHHVKKYFRKHNIEEAIRNDTGLMNVCIVAYNAMPGKKMLAYINKLNPKGGQLIKQKLAEIKKK